MTDWAEEVRLKALATAFKDIKAGKNIDVVLDSMSKALTKKLMHPLFMKLKSPQAEVDVETHRANYNTALDKPALKKYDD